jgi:hypothetical protein
MAKKVTNIVEAINVQLDGETAIMFDKFVGQEKDTRPPEQKYYYDTEGNIVLPAENIYAFLFGENPPGCAKTEGKQSKQFIRMGLAYLIVEPEYILFQRDAQNITFTGFDKTLLDISEFSPRVKMAGGLSIKQNVKKRPLILPPWTLNFTIKLMNNELIDKVRLFNWFSSGGKIIGLGTYRPRFGRFSVTFK